ncbi:hypothetical protein N9Z12_06505, partial [Opitutaceae bacterium]|nr:hypothetical protein [Opitutaceae bacterium]
RSAEEGLLQKCHAIDRWNQSEPVPQRLGLLMPRWLIRMIRMSVIGIGVTMVLLAGINLWAMHALFDASVEHQLGITADELRPLFYVLALIGVLMALLGALVPVPKAMLAKETAKTK